MKLVSFAIVLALSSVAQAAADPDAPPVRQEVAKEVFSFLFDHALCVEGVPAVGQPQEVRGYIPWLDLTSNAGPCDWVYSGAYEMHWAAKELYGTKPLKDIRMPESDWSRGGYERYLDVFAYLEHQSLKLRIWLLIRFGADGIPARQ